MSKVLMCLVLLVSLFAFAPAPVAAAVCNFAADRVEMGSPDSSRTMIGATARRAAQVLSSVQGFQPYRDGRFYSSKGVKLADPTWRNRWQYVYTYVLKTNPANAEPRELMVIAVATHPDAPGLIYWFYIPNYASGNNHPCKAVETSADYAAQLYARLDELPD